MSDSEIRYTFEQWRDICVGIVKWGEALRANYYSEKCDECGILYHPRHGKPPREKNDGCGHAHFREYYTEWRRER